MSSNAICLDPNSTALLVVDVQQALFERPTPIHRADELLDTLSDLVERAHAAGALVVYIRHGNKLLQPGSSGWQLHPRLQPAGEPTGEPVGDDLVIDKTHGDAFQDTSLDAKLKARSITNVVVTGLVTHGCVRATCLGGSNRGYDVVLVADGHSSYHRQAARLIKEWNETLAASLAFVLPAAEIDFAPISAG